MELKAIKALTAAAIMTAATAASAGTAPFSMVSGPTTPGVDVSLTIQESADSPNGFDFIINNNSLMGIITGVYFEVNWDTKLNDSIANTGDGQFESTTLNPSNPDIDGWNGSSASHTVEQKITSVRVNRRTTYNMVVDNLGHGIQEGESHTFSYNALNGLITLQDLEDMVGTDGFGIAIKMQGLTSDEQQTGWGLAEEREEEILTLQSFASLRVADDQVDVVSAPSPTAAVAGLAVLGIAGLRRRRRN